jgi:hypothetical protein
MCSDFIVVQATRKPLFCHSLHFLWCMAHRSLYVVTKVYYSSMSCFATVSPQAPLAVLRFPPHAPLAPSGPQVKNHVIPHSSEQDTLPIVLLISMQVFSNRTRGSTCCPGVSTPKIHSLSNSSNHIT